MLKLHFLEETIIYSSARSKKESFDQVDNLAKAPIPTTENNSIQALDVFAVRVNDMFKLRVL